MTCIGGLGPGSVQYDDDETVYLEAAAGDDHDDDNVYRTGSQDDCCGVMTGCLGDLDLVPIR